MAILGSVRRVIAPSGAGGRATLASTGERRDEDLRKDAEAVLLKAVSAADPMAAVVNSLRAAPPAIPSDGRVWIVALGKAASAMTRGACEVLGDRVAGGMIAVPAGFTTAAPEPIRRFVAGHPLPDAKSEEAAESACEIAGDASPSDLVLVLLSAGGSSVAALPRPGLRVEELAGVADHLIQAGAPRSDLAVVRKRLDALKGGGLALRCTRARALALVASDVPGDHADLVASGPMSPDSSRIGDIRSILKRHSVWTELPLAVRGYLERCLAGEIPETLKERHPCFSRVETRVVSGTKGAAEAALSEAEQRGYESQILSSELVGDAREVGRLLGEMARSLAAMRRPGRSPRCLIAAGATHLDTGRDAPDARNQELVLQAALELDGIEAAILASIGTDGTVSAVQAAGALATGDTVRRAKDSGLDAEAAIESHDAHALLRTLRDLVVTGATGTHVGDVQVLMVG